MPEKIVWKSTRRSGDSACFDHETDAVCWAGDGGTTAKISYFSNEISEGQVVGNAEGKNWPQAALLLQDEVDVLIRWASVNAPEELYTPSALAFWKVCRLLAAEHQRLSAIPCGNKCGEYPQV